VLDPFVTQVPAGAVVAEVRWQGGQAAYEQGHVPGAVYVDLAAVLAGLPGATGGRHPLPAPEAFAAGLSAAGIGDDDVVVACDEGGGVIASRLVWMLRVLGVDAALLEQPPARTESGPAPRRAAHFTARAWPADRIVDIDDIDHLECGVLLDARPRDRFEGAPDDLDPRAGHLPGARSLPCRENVGLDRDALRGRLAEVGVGPDTDVVSSCGSGVTACHTLLVLEQVGYRPGRLYPGSWSEWSRTDRPAG
jgi:thiosulfate/3-mercaptopyruvate sulfurtransferase